MYLNAAVLALAACAYALASGRVDQSPLGGPIPFVLAGLLLGPAVLGALALDATIDHLRLLAEVTLSVVLFSDAANADVEQIRRTRFLPRRLLFVGLPLTILLGLGLSLLLLPGLGLIEAAPRSSPPRSPRPTPRLASRWWSIPPCPRRSARA